MCKKGKDEDIKLCKFCKSFTLMAVSDYLGYNESGICTGQQNDEWLVVESKMSCNLFNK